MRFAAFYVFIAPKLRKMTILDYKSLNFIPFIRSYLIPTVNEGNQILPKCTKRITHDCWKDRVLEKLYIPMLIIYLSTMETTHSLYRAHLNMLDFPICPTFWSMNWWTLWLLYQYAIREIYFRLIWFSRRFLNKVLVLINFLYCYKLLYYK